MSPMPAPPPLRDDPLRIEICRDPDDLARHAASLFVTLAGRALGARGRFSVAFSGGATPRLLYQLLPEPNYAHQVVWAATHVFFTDERCVPPDHEASNYRMVEETLLSRVQVPAGQVHRMPGEAEDRDLAARACETELRENVNGVKGSAPPRLDLVLLGVGEDGHTASIFPGGPELEERTRMVVPSRAPDGMGRLTLTIPVLNAARVAAVLASGERKADIVKRLLGTKAREEGLPIQRVRPADGALVWLLDEAAASGLSSPE